MVGIDYDFSVPKSSTNQAEHEHHVTSQEFPGGSPVVSCGAWAFSFAGGCGWLGRLRCFSGTRHMISQMLNQSLAGFSDSTMIPLHRTFGVLNRYGPRWLAPLTREHGGIAAASTRGHGTQFVTSEAIQVMTILGQVKPWRTKGESPTIDVFDDIHNMYNMYIYIYTD